MPLHTSAAAQQRNFVRLAFCCCLKDHTFERRPMDPVIKLDEPRALCYWNSVVAVWCDGRFLRRGWPRAMSPKRPNPLTTGTREAAN